MVTKNDRLVTELRDVIKLLENRVENLKEYKEKVGN